MVFYSLFIYFLLIYFSGNDKYIFLRVHNQTGATYDNDDVNKMLEGTSPLAFISFTLSPSFSFLFYLFLRFVFTFILGVTVWKSKYRVKISMGIGGSAYTKEFIDSANIIPALALKLKALN